MCRWCHFASCPQCDQEDCDIRYCPDACHGDKGGRWKDDLSDFKDNEISFANQEQEEEHEVTFQKLSPKQKLKNPTLINMFKGLLPSTVTGEVENLVYNTETDNYSELAKNELYMEEDKQEMPNNIRKSKFAGLMNVGTKMIVIIFNLFKNKKGYFVSNEMQTFNKENTSVIKFRKKENDKGKYSDAVMLQKLEPREIEETIDIERRNRISLAAKLKTQFQYTESIRIKELNRPDKLDNYVEEKFKRDKSDITNIMANLENEISI